PCCFYLHPLLAVVQVVMELRLALIRFQLVLRPAAHPGQPTLEERTQGLLQFSAAVPRVPFLDLNGVPAHAEPLENAAVSPELTQHPVGHRRDERLPALEARAVQVTGDVADRLSAMLGHPPLNLRQSDGLEQPLETAQAEEWPPLRIEQAPPDGVHDQP